MNTNMVELTDDVKAFIARRTGGGEVDVVIYGRKSRPSKNKKIQMAISRFDLEKSIQFQISDCTEFANKRGWNIIGTYSDVKTGTTHKRDGLTKLLQTVNQNSKICLILVHRLDRFARGAAFDYLQYDLWNRTNAVLVLPITEILGFDCTQKFTTNVLKDVASLEVNRYVQRSQEIIIDSRAKNALLCGGRPPRGYGVTASGVYYIKEKEAKEIRYIFEAVKSGIGYSDIIENVYKQYGHKISKGSIVSYLRQSKYAGIFIYNKKGGKRRAERVLDKEYEEIRVEKGVPAIVSRELFDEVQAIMDARQITGGRAKNRSSFPLNDKVFCSKCNRQMRGSRSNKSGRNKTAYERYGCPQHKSRLDKCPTKDVGRQALEECVYDIIDVAINTPNFKQAVLEGLRGKCAEIKVRISKLEKDNILLEKEKKEAVKLSVSNAVMREELGILVEENRKIIAGNNDAISQLKDGQQLMSEYTLDSLKIPSCRSFTLDNKLTLIDTYIDKIMVDNDEIRIILHTN